MSIEFFKLPAALKKAIWAAYLAERCSIRAGFCRLPEGSDSPPNGSEKQV